MVEAADFVVLHHVAVGVPEVVHAAHLVAEQLAGLRFAGADHHLAVVNGDGVVVVGGQARAVGETGLE